MSDLAAEQAVLRAETERLLVQRDALRAEVEALRAETDAANRFLAILGSRIEESKAQVATAQAEATEARDHAAREIAVIQNAREHAANTAAARAGMVEIKPGVFLHYSAVQHISYGPDGPGIVTSPRGEGIAIDQAIYPNSTAFFTVLSVVALGATTDRANR